MKKNMKEPNDNILPEVQDVFKVPENYFENFDDQLFAKWKASPQPVAKKVFSISRYAYIGAAAAVLLLVGLGFWLDHSQSNTLNPTDIENYFQSQSLALPSDLAQDFDEDDLKALENSLNLHDLKIDDYLLSSTDIEYYLNE
ncbi:hypothetical protein [Flavobacterium sp. JP2137]|uniref:hypothetical protein n=1 Tax=Flavobacterium sp. JP2137 TaxID=3414510 RepID=UPI003D301213